MELKDIIAADVDDVFFDIEEFGRYVKYEGKEIMAIPDVGEGIRRGKVTERGRSGYFTVKKADVPPPQTHHIIVDTAGKTWYVQEISEETDTVFVLRVATERSAVILGRK